MSVERNKLEQQAMRQLQKGRLEQALGSYQQLLRLDPRSRRVRKTVAELHRRLGVEDELAQRVEASEAQILALRADTEAKARELEALRRRLLEAQRPPETHGFG